jgi:hypothetical protein
MSDLDLRETLKLEQLEVNLFRGFSPAPDAGRIYGGQVIAQSLLAAYATVEGRVCHSLHCYFIRPGDPKIPIIFEVDRSRDGHSFTTRRVIAVQHGRQIFNLAASFQTPETGFEHQAEMPKTVGPEGLPDLAEALGRVGPHLSEEEQRPITCAPSRSASSTPPSPIRTVRPWSRSSAPGFASPIRCRTSRSGIRRRWPTPRTWGCSRPRCGRTARCGIRRRCRAQASTTPCGSTGRPTSPSGTSM